MVQGNFIGTDAAGDLLGNFIDGVLIDNAPGNTIGGADVIGNNGTGGIGDVGVHISWGRVRRGAWCRAITSAPTPPGATWATPATAC